MELMVTAREFALAVVGTLLVATVVGAPSAGGGEHRVADPAAQVTADAIRRHTTVLGGDALEGRAAGSRGGARAASYLVRELMGAGVDPFGDAGGYYQDVPLHGAIPLPGSRLELWSLGEERLLELGADYLLFTTGSQTLIPQFVPMVFVGYGIVAPEFDYNDYHDVDVRGRVVVYLGGEPGSSNDDYFAGERPTVFAAPETKKRIALSRGAVGSLLIPVPSGEVESAWRRTARDFAFEHLSLAYTLPEHLNLVLRPEIADWLFKDALYEFEQVLEMERTSSLRSFHMPSRLRFEGRFQTRDVLAPNVVARVPGRDPYFRDSHVVVSAHYDHLGIGPEEAGDAIYNGVVDNALGVACALEIARSISSMDRPPRRSLVFLFTTAEESGMLGARFFLDHSPVELPDLAANINVDGLAFMDTFDDLVGIGGELSDLGELLRRAVEPLGLAVSDPPDAVWNHAAYGRSDQLAFAERGVPAILVNEGFAWHGSTEDEALEQALEWMATRYHSPSDDLSQSLDLEASALHCEAILHLVIEVANARQPPEWRPGISYAYERLLSRAKRR
jgi:hypothetical protein